jgi:hypothetical protein
MDRPDPTVLREMGRDRRMPVLRSDDHGATVRRHLDLTIHRRHDDIAPSHAQTPIRISKIILHIHHDKRRPRPIPLHLPRVTQTG